MKIKSIIACALAAATFISSCDDNESNIGSSIIEDRISITVDSTFTITGRSVANSAVQSRTLLQLLGRIDAAGYGALSSDVVTQFMPSITPMGIEVYRLNRDLPSPIFSNFDPAGYYDPSQKIGSLIYNASTLGESDSLKNASYHTISVNLPRELAQEFFTAYKNDPSSFSSPSSFINRVFKGIYIRNS